MKIALIAGSKIPSRTANSIQTMKMAQAFVERGHDIKVYVPGVSPDQSWEEIAQQYGVRTQIDIRWLPTIPRLRSYDFGIRAVHQGLHWGADLLYTRLPQAAAYASWRGFATIFEVHDMPSGRFGSRLMRVYLRGRGARRLVTITHALADEIGSMYPVPSLSGFSVIAPDGVDLDRYHDLPAPRKARAALGMADKFTAGYSGHLYPGRGIDLILRVAARLPEFNFMIMGGDQNEIAQLKRSVEEGGLKNILVFGFVSNDKLPGYQAACDALLMPYQVRVSASSGGDIARYLSPMKMFEYLACGRAILASDLPVLQEALISGENALILPSADTGAWVRALKKLSADPDYKVRLGD
ncbi:MAG: glycosyltransferase family 4 protein, partial [Chloroflexi bacterium]|nr:glycosyltransferase family 4 protein [Chloroflexota bacterium]